MEIYRARLAERRQRLEAGDRQGGRAAGLRLAVFIAAAAVVWFAIEGNLSIWWISIPALAFASLMAWQSRIERTARLAQRAIRFYEQGLARIEKRWTDIDSASENGGQRFADPHHPYASDLDLFGHASLFELLSIARTRGGEARLAGWLKQPSPMSELRARHQSIEELRPLLDLREKLAVLGDDFRTGVNPEHLARWAAEPARPFSAGARALAFVLSLATFGILVWWVATDLRDLAPELSLVAVGLLDGVFALSFRNRIRAIVNNIEEPFHDLDLLSQILETLEGEHFTSPALARLRATITVEGHPASARIAHLRRLVELLDSRDNVFLRVFGPLLLWTTQIGMSVEAWRATSGPHVAAWLEAVSEIEALASLANYAWEHPHDPFPEFAEDGTRFEGVFEGEDLRHPLLPDARCVPNSIALAPPLRLLIVSGSNMSGKSTLLRTIGINTVLALAGAPVHAKRLRLSSLSLGASIRTSDSLEEGQSRFMAEIVRLKQILELPAPALFLLDELLNGTNSHDRALGSEGLIRALLDRGAIGLVTTHDLSLARVADDLAPAAANVHFEDRLENSRLVFDYRMRPGIVTRSNALDLMRAVGLDV